ncbi:MAG: NAD-dependent epimerase/dehydratase family protein [Chloroflexota bacterium]|nr:MAG: NAD-dependent epimerase/dehydratase family protein [Chloroflexota bacterium]
MKAYVTGGTGFIGRYLVLQLLERGYDVIGLARSAQSATDLVAMGAKVAYGDITDRASMREGMAGSDVVFHVAGWYAIGSPDWMQAESINVAGTRNVLRLAHELGVPKIVYTSTTTVLGDTHGQMVDETFFQGGPFVTEYDRTKWLAHYKVAIPLIDKGAPIIIVMPGAVYGPGDHSLVGGLMEDFWQGRLPAVFGPDFVHTYAHVEDVAEGHIMAAEKGRVGESYIITGPAVPLGEIVDFWGMITGKPGPKLAIPARLVKPFAPIIGMLGENLPLPPMYSQEAAGLLSCTYMARADKARAELGWRPRSLQEGMSETFHWIDQATPPKQPTIQQKERQIAGAALLLAALIFILWLLGRRRK